MNEGADKSLRDAVVSYLGVLKTTDAAWDNLFPRMATATRTKWRTHFRSLWTTTPIATSVRLGYPRDEQKWPVVGFVLTPNTPEQAVAARSGGYTTGANPYEVFEQPAAQNVTAYVVAKGNADEARMLALLVVAGGLAARDYLCSDAVGFAGYEYTGMQDLHPADVYLPEDCYVRLVTFSVTEMMQVGVVPSQTFIAGPGYVALDGENAGDGHTGQVVVAETL